MGKRITKREQAELLAIVAETGNVAEAARTLGKRPRASYYTFAIANPDFAKALKEARDAHINNLEGQVLDWAQNGWTELTQEQNAAGKVTKRKAVKKVDPRLALRVLERRHPDYKPKVEAEHTAKQGVLIVPGIIASDDEFDAAFGNG